MGFIRIGKDSSKIHDANLDDLYLKMQKPLPHTVREFSNRKITGFCVLQVKIRFIRQK